MIDIKLPLDKYLTALSLKFNSASLHSITQVWIISKISHNIYVA